MSDETTPDTPSSVCAWGVVGAPACEAGTRALPYWCRHCMIRRAESAEAALAGLRERVEALASEWSEPKSLRDDAWLRERDVADRLRALLAPTPDREEGR